MITGDKIGNAQILMERDAAHHNPTETPKIADTKAMMEFLEDSKGEDKTPFPYIYHLNVDSLVEVVDLRTKYTSVEEEMIAQDPYTLPVYTVDNAALAKLLKEMVVGFKDDITWARDSFHARDGQAIMAD
jgi:hypothetical protein